MSRDGAAIVARCRRHRETASASQGFPPAGSRDRPGLMVEAYALSVSATPIHDAMGSGI